MIVLSIDTVKLGTLADHLESREFAGRSWSYIRWFRSRDERPGSILEYGVMLRRVPQSLI